MENTGNNKKITIYKILLTVLIIVAIVITSIILKKQYNDKVYDIENKEIVELFHNQEENKKNDGNIKKIELKYKEFDVIGLIKIPAIDLEYPILGGTTMKMIDTSIIRFYGGEINEYGNVSLAGHNNYNGTMFGKNKNLKVEDKILLTDLTGRTIEYVIYDIFVTDPNDTSILETKDEKTREVTLITCKNGRSQRLIIKAREDI